MEFLAVDWEKRYCLLLGMGPYSAPNIDKQEPCPDRVLWLILRVPLVSLQCVIVVFPDHT